ncbi:unnamed protein product [Closterium sp. NIES-54]
MSHMPIHPHPRPQPTLLHPTLTPVTPPPLPPATTPTPTATAAAKPACADGLQAPTGNQPFSPNSPHSPQIHPLQHSLLPPSRWHQLRLPSHLPHHHHSPPLPRPRPPPPPSPRLPPPPRPSPAPAPVPAPAPAVPVAAASDHSHPPYCLPQNCPARPRSSPHVQGSHSYDTSQPLLPSPHALSVALCPPLPSALCLPFPLSCSTLQLYILHSPPPPSPHLSQSSSPSFSNTAPRLSQQ